MTYYILLPGDTLDDCQFESNQLGEVSFNTFYPAAGLSALMNIVNESPELLSELRIFKDNSESLSVEEFLTELNGLKIRKK